MNEDDPPHIQRIPPGPERETHLPLLLLADEPEPLRAYLQAGDLYALRAGVLRPVLHVGPDGFVRQSRFIQYRVNGSHEDPLHPLRPTFSSRAGSSHRAPLRGEWCGTRCRE